MKTLLATALLAAAGMAFGMKLQVPDAPFNRKQKTETAETIFSKTGFQCGSKSLFWQNAFHHTQITNAGQSVCGFISYAGPVQSGWDPFIHFKERMEPAKKQMIRTCTVKLKGNIPCTLRQKLQLRDDKKILSEYSFDFGPGGEKVFTNLTFKILFPRHAVEGKTFLTVDREGKEVRTVMGKGSNWKNMGSFFKDVKKLVFDQENPANTFSLEFPVPVNLNIFAGKKDAILYLNLKLNAFPFRMVIDFGEKGIAAEKDNIVEGINFTGNNDFTVSIFDPKRNFFINPSFESGLRYFNSSWLDLSGLLYDKAARTGKYSLRPNGVSLGSFCFPIQANTDYTLSFYARSVDGKPGYAFINANTYGGSKSPNRFLKAHVTNVEWQRFEYKLNYPTRSVNFRFLGDGKVLIDDLQFEKGAKASEYAGNRIGIELVTDSPEKTLVNTGAPVNARFRLRGPAGTKGRIKLNVTDFFKRDLLAKEIPFEIPQSGETVLPIAEDKAFVNGVNLIKTIVEPEGLRPYTDFFRLNIFKYANATAKNRAIHALSSTLPWLDAKRVPDSFYHLLKICGFGTHTYHPVGSNQKEFWDRIANNGMRSYGAYILNVSVTRRISRIGDEVLKVNGKDPYLEMTEYPPELLKRMEELAYREAKKYPHILFWSAPAEPFGFCAALRNGKPREYAKLLLALNRGLMRANPEIAFNPCSSCNIGKGGRKDVLNLLRVCREVDPKTTFKIVDIHVYRPFPEMPDLDNDIQAFLQELNELGYGKMRIYFAEGIYHYPLIVNEWLEVAPWQGTGNKDRFYLQHFPSYDLGWGERIGAAQTLRSWLAVYKHMDRIETAAPWAPFQLDETNPFAWGVMSAALTELLGNSDFKDDIRFASGARAYLFENNQQHAIAVIWKFDENMDRGTKKSDEMNLDYAGSDIEFIDMMGNRCAVSRKNGKYTLPLSGFPIFIRTKLQNRKQLTHAVRNISVAGTGTLPLELTAYATTPETVEIKAINMLSRPVKTDVSIGNAPFAPVEIASQGTRLFSVPLKKRLSFREFSDIEIPVSMKTDGKTESTVFKTNVLPVKYAESGFSWNGIPAVPVRHIHLEGFARQNGEKWNGPKDLSAFMKIAWNEENLFLRFEINDDKFVMNHEKPKPFWWYDNDTIQLFIDTTGNARENARRGIYGFDLDDYSYELLPTSETSAIVFRRHAPDHQLTGGVYGGFKPNVVEPGVVCKFQKSGTRLVYDVTFPIRYLQPMRLEPGSYPGIGIKIYDRDDPKRPAKQHLSNIDPRIGDAFGRPDLYTQLLFIK